MEKANLDNCTPEVEKPYSHKPFFMSSEIGISDHFHLSWQIMFYIFPAIKKHKKHFCFLTPAENLVYNLLFSGLGYIHRKNLKNTELYMDFFSFWSLFEELHKFMMKFNI